MLGLSGSSLSVSDTFSGVLGEGNCVAFPSAPAWLAVDMCYEALHLGVGRYLGVVVSSERCFLDSLTPKIHWRGDDFSFS